MPFEGVHVSNVQRNATSEVLGSVWFQSGGLHTDAPFGEQ